MDGDAVNSIRLDWKGREYVIPADEAFVVGEAVEDIITLADLQELAKRPKFRKIARVYGVMLRHAGARVSDEEVHAEMMAQIKAAGANGEDLLVASAMDSLVAILMDGAPEGDGDGEKKTGGASSRPRFKRRSGS